MTITYTAEVATCTGLGCFWRLLFRWRGSIYKLLWPNLVAYSGVYFFLSVTYRFLLSAEHRNFFEKVSLHCQAYGDLIPIAFVLGFYVSIVIKRWWDQYICMPWPDNLAMFVSTLVHGQDERGRLMRRTIIRYVNLCLVITLRMMSPRVKKRFPTLEHLVEAGFMQAGEKKIFEDLDQKTSHPKYWMPLVWAGGVLTRARKEGRIKDDFSLKTLIDELNIFRSGCGGMLNYDWISIPLVYTQVVTLAVYVYFMSSLMANQFLDPSKGYPKHEVDLVLPVFTFLQFFFYMGWLKVAESLVNPFGEDDDDFELNWLVDRNLQVSYVIVDEMHQEHPQLVKDQYWDEVFPAELPYTAASKQYQTGPPPLSTDNVEVSGEQAGFMPLDTVAEDGGGVLEADDLDLELELSGLKGPPLPPPLLQSHPVRIVKGGKAGSGGSMAATASLSGPCGGDTEGGTSRRSSVLHMLSTLLRRDASSHLGSSVSLPSRRPPRCSSRLSAARDAAAFPDDEMFRMSDVSLCEGGGEGGTQDTSDASGSSVKTSVFQDWMEGGSVSDSYRARSDWKDLCPPCGLPPTDGGAGTRVVVPSSCPVRHAFQPSPGGAQGGAADVAQGPGRRREWVTSCLSRSLHQQEVVAQPPPPSVHPVLMVLPPPAPVVAAGDVVPQPSVSLSSWVASTSSLTTVVSSSSSSGHGVTLATTLSAPQVCTRMACSPSSVTGFAPPPAPPPAPSTPPTLPPDDAVALETILEEPLHKQTVTTLCTCTTGGAGGASPLPYVTSAAIPVPAAGGSPSPPPPPPLSPGGGQSGATTRRAAAHHDFHHELEPISEHGEVPADSPCTTGAPPGRPPDTVV